MRIKEADSTAETASFFVLGLYIFRRRGTDQDTVSVNFFAGGRLNTLPENDIINCKIAHTAEIAKRTADNRNVSEAMI